MENTDQEKEDKVLRRMLKTPPKPRKDKKHPHIKRGEPKPAPSGSDRKDSD